MHFFLVCAPRYVYSMPNGNSVTNTYIHMFVLNVSCHIVASTPKTPSSNEILARFRSRLGKYRLFIMIVRFRLYFEFSATNFTIFVLKSLPLLLSVGEPWRYVSVVLKFHSPSEM